MVNTIKRPRRVGTAYKISCKKYARHAMIYYNIYLALCKGRKLENATLPHNAVRVIPVNFSQMANILTSCTPINSRIRIAHFHLELLNLHSLWRTSFDKNISKLQKKSAVFSCYSTFIVYSDAYLKN